MLSLRRSSFRGSLLLGALLLTLLSGNLPAEVPSDPGLRYEDDKSLPEHAEDVVDYTLHAELEPKGHTVHGEGSITWRNTSEKAQSEVWVHLYLNAFKNERSTFMREPASGSRGGGSVTDWGTIDVKRFAFEGNDLWPGADMTGGRPGDPDETDVRVPLPHEVPPGGTAVFEVTWDDKLPTIVERTGYHGSFHMMGQWFPKIARLEPDGRWAHFPFHHLAEFYADFGTYDVTIEAPKGYVLGATGPVVESHDDGDMHTERHVQHDVHDFAWTAFDQYQERNETIDGVHVRVLFPRGYGYAAQREIETMRFAIPYYGKRYGRYPYETLTLVHPPEGRRRSGRHGVPDAHHDRRSVVGPARRHGHRARDHPRVRPSVVLRDARVRRGDVAVPRRRDEQLRRRGWPARLAW